MRKPRISSVLRVVFATLLLQQYYVSPFQHQLISTRCSTLTKFTSVGLRDFGAPIGCRYSRLTVASTPSNDDESYDQKMSDVSALWIFGGIPILSAILPILLQAKLIAPLLIAKRAYVYILAASVLAIASLRGSSDESALGSRLINLTQEILPNFQNIQDKTKEDTRFQELGVLNEVDSSAQAVGLPLIVVSSLVASLFFVLLQQTDTSNSSTDLQPFLESFKSLLPALNTLSNGLVLLLFARAELKRLPLPGGDTQSDFISTVGACSLVALAYLGPVAYVWPIQNILCICLAIAVARAIQLPRLAPILLASTCLVLYDVASVGIQLINLGGDVLASQSGEGAASAAAASSAMGTIALSKAGGTWQPGLFEVYLRGIATDLLGLGDAVFPSLLSTFCLRFDQSESTNYFLASLVGFATGCLACEFVPGISSSGLPALLFIVPSMIGFVGVPVLVQGNLKTFWSFDPSSGDENES